MLPKAAHLRAWGSAVTLPQLRQEGTSGNHPNCPAQAVSDGAACSQPCPAGPRVPPRMETPQPPQATNASTQSPSQSVSCVSVSAFYLWSCPWEPLKREWLSSFLHLPFTNSYILMRFPLSLFFSRLKSQLSQPFFVQSKMLQSLNHLHGPLLDFLHYVLET